MDINNTFSSLDDDKIVRLEAEPSDQLGAYLNGSNLLNLSFDQLILLIINRFNVTVTFKDLMFNKGINCEVLIPGKAWQKGKIKIKICLEFIPDEPEIEEETVTDQPEISEPESPLDDIRRQISENSQ